MKYLQTKFKISCDGASAVAEGVMSETDLLQACRELLADECGECGYESFEDTDEGVIGYIQQEESCCFTPRITVTEKQHPQAQVH